jgi:hypothetical protein
VSNIPDNFVQQLATSEMNPGTQTNTLISINAAGGTAGTSTNVFNNATTLPSFESMSSTLSTNNIATQAAEQNSSSGSQLTTNTLGLTSSYINTLNNATSYNGGSTSGNTTINNTIHNEPFFNGAQANTSIVSSSKS